MRQMAQRNVEWYSIDTYGVALCMRCLADLFDILVFLVVTAAKAISPKPPKIQTELFVQKYKHKRRNSLNWLSFTARRSEDSSTQRLHHVMVSRQSSHSMTSCLPADRCSICGLYFWWFQRDSLHVTPQASSAIRHNIEIFRVILSNLMFR